MPEPSSAPYRSSSPSTLVLPLRSDPPWLPYALFAVALACVGIFALYFHLRVPSLSLTLALLPGLALATFACAAAAFWARRRGGVMQLEAAQARLTLREPRRHEELLDRALPFGAVLLRDRSTPRRVLLLSQHQEPVTILDAGRAAQAATPAGAWSARVIDLDLSGVAVSASTPHVLTLAASEHVEPLLATLEPDLDEAAPLLSHPLPGGEVLLVRRDEVRIGSRAVPVGSGSTARRISVETPAGPITALSLLSGDSTLLLACQDPNEQNEGRTPSTAPDAYLPPLVFAVLEHLFAPQG